MTNARSPALAIQHIDIPDGRKNASCASRQRSWLSRAPATGVIILVNVTVYAVLLGLAAISEQLAHDVEHALWNSPHLVTHRYWVWQVFTANFVHLGFLHLAVNMLFVAWLSPRLEEALGSRRFLFLYLGAGVFAYTVYDLFNPLLGGHTTSVGASGCVLAVVTLYTVCFPKRMVRLYGFWAVPFRWIVFLYIFSDISWFFWAGGSPWINNVVHLAGAAFGAGCGFVFRHAVNSDERQRDL